LYVNKLKYKHIKLFGWMPVFNLACSLCFGITYMNVSLKCKYADVFTDGMLNKNRQFIQW